MAQSNKLQPQVSSKYGYNGFIEKLRTTEFTRLKDAVYLDHAGATQYSSSQMAAIYRDLTSNVYGNPHSRHPSSKLTSDLVDQVRTRVASYFNTNLDEYSIVFTSGATSAIKLLSETFPWSDNQDGVVTSAFVYLEDNHTSVLGVREVAAVNGAQVVCLPSTQAPLIMDKLRSQKANDIATNCNCLFAYPAESNFSGRKYPLRWISSVKNGALHSLVASDAAMRWFTLLDAACLVGTSPLDLQLWQPDFVAISFYKIFGFPTGLGALVVHKRAEPFLRTTYFGGGNVLVAISSHRFHVMRPTIEEKLESGTLPFLDILALRHGFEALDTIPGGMIGIRDHTFAVASYSFSKLVLLHHFNGSPLVRIYSDTGFNDVDSQGAIISLNLLRPDGQFIGFAEVEKMAALFDIHLRTGCFCNPGACQRHLGLTSQDLRHHFQSGHVCGDDKDLVDGKPTGCVRISFGYMSTIEEADRFLAMLKNCFLVLNETSPVDSTTLASAATSIVSFEQSNPDTVNSSIVNNEKLSSAEDTLIQLKSALSQDKTTKITKICRCVHHGLTNCQQTHLMNIFIYPIKSCGAFQTQCWMVGNRGFLYDREWVVITSGGVVLTQKREARMCLIKPELDLENGVLWLHGSGAESINVPLKYESGTTVSIRQTKVCSDRVEGLDCGDEVANWISDVLDRNDCRLIRQLQTSDRTCRQKSQTDGKVSLSLANEAQYLFVNRESVAVLAAKIEPEYGGYGDEDENVDRIVTRFRPNFVVGAVPPFAEDAWQGVVKIGQQTFKIQGKCTRCQMICIDQETGQKSKELLLNLSATRGHKMTFGLYLAHESQENDNVIVTVGDPVIAPV